MSEKKILVIDDSATIRKLADSFLSPSGYRVSLAATADDGLRLAEEIQPDLILLDHQLPGTTGFEVCQRLLADPQLRQIPVVVSSTLRKRAYVEYAELPNVVDMLPKPYTSDLLGTTVENALSTGALVIASQEGGTSVPEVIQELGEADFAGSFRRFGLREVIDLLNNGHHAGVLEVEAQHFRVACWLQEGRIQGVSATGVDTQELVDTLPDTLRSLAAVFRLTINGQGCSQLEGLVELLDQRVLDPRLLCQLLRHQASMLLLKCFRSPLKEFRFDASRTPPQLFTKLPLNTSLWALLIEGAQRCGADQLPEQPEGAVYGRRLIRGQNLDRTGVAPQHLKLLTLLAEPQSAEALAKGMGWSAEETRRVLAGFVLAELIEIRENQGLGEVVLFDPDTASATRLRALLDQGARGWSGRVVRDPLALGLVLKRAHPDVIVMRVDCEAAASTLADVRRQVGEALQSVRWIALTGPDVSEEDALRRAEELGIPAVGHLAITCGSEALASAIQAAYDSEAPAAPALVAQG